LGPAGEPQSIRMVGRANTSRTRGRPARARPFRRARGGAYCVWSLAVCLITAFFAVAPAHAVEPVKGEVSVTTAGGYARIIFRLTEDVESDVRGLSGVLVITFKRPVDLSVDRLNAAAPSCGARSKGQGQFRDRG
jgi:hypothetical protein